VAFSPQAIPVSLKVRLTAAVAIVVAVVLSTRALVQVTLVERRAERDAREAVREAGAELAERFTRGPWPPDAGAAHDAVEVAAEQPLLQRVTLVDAGAATSIVTSGAAVQDDEVALAHRAISSVQAQMPPPQGDRVLAAVPVTHEGRAVAAVVVTASLAPVRALGAEQRRLTPWFGLGAFLAITGLLVAMGRWAIDRPIQRILATLQRTREGDLDARVRLQRRDELGRVAGALDDMLDHMRQLDASNRERIDEATRELRKTNDDLVRSYQRMFALREALARAEQTAAAGQTAANLAHQVGTPLNLVSGYVQMMLEEPGTDARQVERLRTIQEQIKKVTGYIRATLDHVRMPAAQKEPVYPGAMLRRIADVSRPRLNAAGIELVLDAPEELPWLTGDPVRLELALLNLIKNSLDAMPEGGRIEIRAIAWDGITRIDVADTGPGIPAELLPRIFEPWVTTKPPGQGTGLGLSFTREVVQAHGGTIDVHSVAGKGATFTIVLPGKGGEP
jgi:signal transduction histidine kinase